MSLNVRIHFPELTPVTFVYDEYYLFSLIKAYYFLNFFVITFDRLSHFLYGCDDQFFLSSALWLKLLNQGAGVVCVVYTSVVETVVLGNRLVIQVFPVYEEYHFVD